MAKYNLQPNESIILKCDRVRHGGFWSGYRNELLLTNLNIVLISKGIFGNTKDITVYPVNQIKVFNDQIQIIIGKQRNGFPQLEVYFLNSQETFGFESKKVAEKLANSINQLVTGSTGSFHTTKSFAIPGTEFIAERLKDTVDTFKEALGFKSKTSNNDSSEKVVRNCASCGAPISGLKGQVVFCQYCSTKQKL